MTVHETPIPVIMVLAHTDMTGGIRYLAANVLAKNLLKLMRHTDFSTYDLEIIQNDLHFKVIHQNGQPVPLAFPKGAYQRKSEVKPRHVCDDC